VVDVTDRPDVDMGLGSFEFGFGHGKRSLAMFFKISL
jgi:hypothetical protein